MARRKEQISLAEVTATYANLVKHVAARLWKKQAGRQPALSFDDLYHAGICGLIEAHRSYDARFGVPYQAYISLRILWEVYKEFFKFSPCSRTAVDYFRLHLEDKALLEQIYGRPVSSDEMADFLAMPLEVYERKLAFFARAFPRFIRHSAIGEEYLPQEQVAEYGDAEGQAGKSEMSAVVSSLLDILSPKERAVITGIYFMDLDLSEVGGAMSPPVSKQRVAVIRDRALKKLRKRFPRNAALLDIFYV